VSARVPIRTSSRRIARSTPSCSNRGHRSTLVVAGDRHRQDGHVRRARAHRGLAWRSRADPRASRRADPASTAQVRGVGLWPDVEKGKRARRPLAKVVLARCSRCAANGSLAGRATHFTLDHRRRGASRRREGLPHDPRPLRRAKRRRRHRDAGPRRRRRARRVFESVAYRYEIQQAIAEGFLVPIVARRVVVDSVDLSTWRRAPATSRRTSSPR
jgi:hypothetical protein